MDPAPTVWQYEQAMSHELASVPRPNAGLQIEVFATSPGPITLEATTVHRVRVHAGSPTRGLCGAHRFVYQRGDVDVLPAGVADAWYGDDASTAVVLNLSPALLARAAEELGRGSARPALEARHQFRDAQIEHLAWALDAERTQGYPNGSLYAETLGLALGLHLLGGHGSTPSTKPRLGRGLSKPQLRRVTSYIEEHIDQDLSLATVAAIAGVSASHLKTLFRRSTGLPVHEYVVQRRVERARTLLLEGELPQSEIALRAGFAHQSHMARSMRRLLGVTPKAIARASVG